LVDVEYLPYENRWKGAAEEDSSDNNEELIIWMRISLTSAKVFAKIILPSNAAMLKHQITSLNICSRHMQLGTSFEG
jgi:hypothetical protein